MIGGGTRKMGTGVMSGALSARSGYQSSYPMDFMSGRNSRAFHTRGASYATGTIDANKPDFPGTAPGLPRPRNLGQS